MFKAHYCNKCNESYSILPHEYYQEGVDLMLCPECRSKYKVENIEAEYSRYVHRKLKELKRDCR